MTAGRASGRARKQEWCHHVSEKNYSLINQSLPIMQHNTAVTPIKRTIIHYRPVQNPASCCYFWSCREFFTLSSTVPSPLTAVQHKAVDFDCLRLSQSVHRHVTAITQQSTGSSRCSSCSFKPRSWQRHHITWQVGSQGPAESLAWVLQSVNSFASLT